MLRHITIIGSDGITIYHKSYVQNDLDDVLFSALSGAIIAFSKELGDELFSIIMKKQMIYFQTLKENIVIFSLETNDDMSPAELKIRLNKATKLETVQLICDMGITQQINTQLDGELIDLFGMDVDPVEAEPKIDEITIEELTGDAFLEALNKLDSM